MFSIRKGDTWDYVGYANIKNNGSLIDVTDWQIKSQAIDNAGNLVCEFDCEWTNLSKQEFTHKLTDTSCFVVGRKYTFNVKFSYMDEIISSEAFYIKIGKEITA